MNYAQDALWWRLTNPVVRDLASLLTAPALWKSGCELSRRELLGEHGFRYLLQLNDNPHLLPENLFAPRLGHYAENLLAFWFRHAPHSQLLAHNLAVFDAQTKQQQGALDFVVQLNHQLYHLELTCKYYGSPTGLPETMCGLNRQDTLLNKQAKLIAQLQLSGSLNAQAVLRKHQIDTQKLTRVSIIRGCAFTHSGSLNNDLIYPVNTWSGRLIDGEDGFQYFDSTDKFYVFAPHQYLAPARVSAEHIISLDEVKTIRKALVAKVALRHDGFWYEQERLMLPENF